MKKSALFLSLFVLQVVCSNVYSQTLSPDVQAVFDACVSLRAAIGSGNTTSLKSANTVLKRCDTQVFSSLRCKSEKPLSLEGHFVFQTDFVDSLIAGRNVYKFAQRYAEPRSVRGSSSSGKVFVKNCAVRGHQTETFTFTGRGHQELAVVTEPGGQLTLRIHDKTNDKWYNDTKSVKKGQPTRIIVFELPTETRNSLEVEVINCGKKDISFVMISN